MPRYVDVDKLIEEYDRVHIGAPGGARKLMVDAPTADVQEVRHGEWIEKAILLEWCEDDVDIVFECSYCETECPFTSDYCPNCGAMMRGEGNGT